jgi:hypothetical protein
MKISQFKQQLITEVKRLIKEAATRINRDELIQKIKDTKGAFFTVTFVKKDGTTRVMNARLGVKLYLKGGTLAYDAESKGLVPVWDPIAQKETGNGYRMVSLATITNLKIGKNNYNVE